MKSYLWAAIALILITSPAHAASNEGIVLMVHGVPYGEHTVNCDVPETCEELTSNTEPDAFGIEWFLVVLVSPPENEPNFNTVTFSIGDYDTNDLYVAYTGPCHRELDPLEVPLGGWPLPISGVGISWAPNCLTSHIEPVYYMGAYVYGPETVYFGNFYGSSSSVVDCGFPPEEDPFADFAAMGFGGDPGYNPECPEPTAADVTTWGRIKRMYR